MFSKIIIKLIDEAIVPAVLLLTVRLVSVVLISKQLNVPFTVANSGFIFSSSEDYLRINSYSILVMLIVLTLGLLYVLTKSLFFHKSHISPRLTAQVFSLKLSFFIQNSFEIYSQGAIWVSYLYLMTLVAGLMAVFGLLFGWVFYTALVLSVIATTMLIIDIEKELRLQEEESYNMDYYEDDEETLVLEFGEDYV